MKLLLAGIITSLLAQEQEAPKSYTAEEVVNTSVAKGIINNYLKSDHFTFKKYEKKEKLDNDLNVEEIENTSTYLVFKKEGVVVEQLLEKNGEKIENGEIKEGLSNPYDIDFNAILLEKYEFKISDSVPLDIQNKIGAYIIDFYPKENLEEKTRADKLLNKLTGSIYIDREFNTWGVRCKLPDNEKAPSWYWFLADMNFFEMSMSQKKIDGLMVVDRIEVTLQYRILFSTKRERYIREYIDYEKTVAPIN